MNRTHSRYRGSAYLLVLTGSIAIAIAGLTAMHIARTARFATAAVPEQSQARILAFSALDHAFFTIDAYVDADRKGGLKWREAMTDGQTFGPYSMGEGSFSWTISDQSSDGSLSDNESDSIRVLASGQHDGITHTLEAVLDPGQGTLPLTFLETAAYSPEFHVHTGAVLFTDQVVGSDWHIDDHGGTIDGDAESGKNVKVTVTGTESNHVTVRSVPTGSFYDYYVANGTEISVWSLPSESSFRQLRRLVLSPTNNPFGDESREGIYVIDCHNQNIRIESCRIVGTLVLIDPGTDSLIDKNIVWEPAYPNYPALIVDGTIHMNFNEDAEGDIVSESDISGNGHSINLNPSHTPYQGESDGSVIADGDQVTAISNGETYDSATHDDVYPSVIRGLVAVTGELDFDGGHPVIEGVVYAGKFEMKAGVSVTLTYNPIYYSDPPPGFYELGGGGAPFLKQGSIVRVTSP